MSTYRGQTDYPRNQQRKIEVLTKSIPIIVQAVEAESGSTYSTRKLMEVYEKKNGSKFTEVLQNDYDHTFGRYSRRELTDLIQQPWFRY